MDHSGCGGERQLMGVGSSTMLVRLGGKHLTPVPLLAPRTIFFFFEEMVPFPMDILAAFEEKQSVICNDQSNFWLLYLFLYFALVLF